MDFGLMKKRLTRSQKNVIEKEGRRGEKVKICYFI
jgi:hypothetical protein